MRKLFSFIDELSLILLILVCTVLLVGCAARGGIVVDTTGMTPEEIERIEWKIKYAVAVDWYDYTLKSYKATLDSMPEVDATAFHAKVWPTARKIDVALKTMGIAVGGWTFDQKTAEDNYKIYMLIRTELLKLLAK